MFDASPRGAKRLPLALKTAVLPPPRAAELRARRELQQLCQKLSRDGFSRQTRPLLIVIDRCATGDTQMQHMALLALCAGGARALVARNPRRAAGRAVGRGLVGARRAAAAAATEHRVAAGDQQCGNQNVAVPSICVARLRGGSRRSRGSRRGYSEWRPNGRIDGPDEREAELAGWCGPRYSRGGSRRPTPRGATWDIPRGDRTRGRRSTAPTIERVRVGPKQKVTRRKTRRRKDTRSIKEPEAETNRAERAWSWTCCRNSGDRAVGSHAGDHVRVDWQLKTSSGAALDAKELLFDTGNVDVVVARPRGRRTPRASDRVAAASRRGSCHDRRGDAAATPRTDRAASASTRRSAGRPRRLPARAPRRFGGRRP